ncbi:Uncharacterised protein [Mycobacteroides abscessus subsp. abscessus]|nr:Uncharacterised protein [Mycobacteroides abscessus]SHQ06653.1 Uncharacterised protein [Mycobacteroides abscessus subsp. abscessus]SKF59246.1 Uncharacterised protein [Mycobacteroides abscessus subsp. massiliense]SHQ24718.1 Uncharacterised protein [Mycobacteroides abscessus subsp. abscessus]SHR18104.1 Uncharacterised protein [Mycobacteroides abscessus subsp. abscessus]
MDRFTRMLGVSTSGFHGSSNHLFPSCVAFWKIVWNLDALFAKVPMTGVSSVVMPIS